MEKDLPEKQCLSCGELLTKENTYNQTGGNRLRSYCKKCHKVTTYINKFKKMSPERVQEEIKRYRDLILKHKEYIILAKDYLSKL